MRGWEEGKGEQCLSDAGDVCQREGPLSSALLQETGWFLKTAPTSDL